MFCSLHHTGCGEHNVSKPYGKIARTRRPPTAKKDGGAAFKVRIRSENGDTLSMQEIRDGLYETARLLQSHQDCHRAKWVTLYLTVLDRTGKEILPDPSGAWEICPYKSAADEHNA